MNTPDFTLPALSALAVSLATACVVLFKLDLTDAQKGALTVIVGAVCTIGWFAHDAIVRHGRSKIAAALVTNPPPVDAVAKVAPVVAPAAPAPARRVRKRV